jgi:hypothetical protein
LKQALPPLSAKNPNNNNHNQNQLSLNDILSPKNQQSNLFKQAKTHLKAKNPSLHPN